MRLFTLISLCSMLGAAAFAAETLSWSFTKDGEWLGWTADNFQQAAVQGGAITGVTRKFSFLI